MQTGRLSDACSAAKRYLAAADVQNPFFVAFDAASDLGGLRASLSSCETVRVSDFCSTPHSLPDEDRIMTRLASATSERILLLGLGEYSALTGTDSLENKVYGMVLRSARVVVPLWNGYEHLDRRMAEDPRIRDRRVVAIERTGRHWTVRSYRKGVLDKAQADGFRSLLNILEEGCDSVVSVITSINLDGVWCRSVDSAYDVYCERHPGCSIRQGMFDENQWKMFLDEERERDLNLDSADSLLGILEAGAPSDPYVSYAVGCTSRHADWRWNLVNAILKVDPAASDFKTLYLRRKALMSNFGHEDIAQFVKATRQRIDDPARQIAYLTDSTAEEKDEIAYAVRKCAAFPESVTASYPSLSDYLRDFKFSGSAMADELTAYFAAYKRQKVLNGIDPRFLAQARDIAERRPHLALPTRESVLEQITGSEVSLFWMDALGCEFLGLIQSAAERCGLRMKVTATRARLPTVTHVNRAFYDEWKGLKFDPHKDLDKIKHGDFDCWAGDRKDYPAHLPNEIAVVEDAISRIARWLKSHAKGKVVLTSDHGATRLAVISESVTVWEMPEKGKHGGRCCMVSEFDGELPSCVTQSDDGKWLVLAGYDRFRGGRAGDVEVHGGATLEEMVVPVIELELRDCNVRIDLLESRFKVTYKDAEIALCVLSSASLASPAVEFGGVRYSAAASAGVGGRYEVKMPKPPPGEYSADVFDGDTRVGSVGFSVVSGGATINKVDDFFGV